MTLTYRPVEPDEYEARFLAESRAYGTRWTKEQINVYRPVFDFDRSLSAFDGDRPVGSTGSLALEMTVPGATVPTAVVSWVSVQPTHRRRGVLTELMRRQLADLHRCGEPIAALHASESGIYGRFGYGLGSRLERWEIDTARSRFVSSSLPPGDIRLVEVDEASRTMPPVYERVRAARPGFLSRNEPLWRLWFWDGKDSVEGEKALFALHETDGEADGYAVYRLGGGWQEGIPRRALRVVELIGDSAGIEAALWRYCFDMDLIETVESFNRPLDDALPWILAEPRRLRRTQSDALWVRLVDVAEALASRRYPVSGRLVIDVDDPFCDWNNGRHLLEGGPDSATCVRTSQDADLALSAADLGAIYLGGISPSVLARAGRIRELRPGALDTADSMFSWPLAPWCPAFDPIT